ncbi:MAG TPA: lactate utilization protein [Bryobacteraceae bacterium]|nr:lactate utilization protein [Bryobacteraceae bacterium]
MSREDVLHRVRTALGRDAGQPAPAPPPVRLRIPEVSPEARIASMTARLEALAGRVCRVSTPAAARAAVAEILGDRTAIISNAPYLKECGLSTLPGVRSGIYDRDQLRALCSTLDVGITSADYALADTGTLVLLSSPQEARLISLLPPAHIAVLPCSRLLTGLDELFSSRPDPAAVSSSMVLITGPSRTADIEQILVRGVHGPGQITVILVG